MKFRSLFIHTLLLVVFLLPILSFAQDGVGGSGPGTGVGGSGPGTGNSSITIPNPLSGKASNVTEFIELIINNIVLPIGGMIAVGYIMYAGFILATAQGDTKQIQKGKDAFFNAAIGTAILLGAWVIVEVVKNTICSLGPDVCS